MFTMNFDSDEFFIERFSFSWLISSSTSPFMFLRTSRNLSHRTVVLPGTIVFTSIEEMKPFFESVAFIVRVLFLFFNKTLLVIDSAFLFVVKLFVYDISFLSVSHGQMNFIFPPAYLLLHYNIFKD